MKIPLTLLAAALVLSACGGGSSSAGPTPETTPETTNDQAGNAPVQPESVTDNNTVDDADPTDADIDPQEPISDQTDTLSEPNDSTTYESRLSDPVWRICTGDTGLDSRDAWQRQLVQPGTYRDCIKVCPTDDNFIPDPDFPGLGWDNRLRTACAVITNPEAQLYHPVPLYLPGQQPTRQSFHNIGAFQVHSGGGQWQCSHQQRNLSSDSFTDTGIQITYRFYGDGTVDTRNSAETVLDNGRWWFDAFSGTRIIGVPTGTTDDRFIPQRYVGNVQVSANNMTIYRTTVDRLSCASTRSDNSLERFPLSQEQLATLPLLTIDNLLNRPMSCQPYDAATVSIDSQAFTQTGFRSALDRSAAETFIEINQSASVDATGQTRYEFQSNATTSYTVENDGLFSSEFRNPGDVTRSFSDHLVEFRQFNNSVIMIDEHALGGSGSSSRTLTYSHCTVVQ